MARGNIDFFQRPEIQELLAALNRAGPAGIGVGALASQLVATTSALRALLLRLESEGCVRHVIRPGTNPGAQSAAFDYALTDAGLKWVPLKRHLDPAPAKESPLVQAMACWGHPRSGPPTQAARCARARDKDASGYVPLTTWVHAGRRTLGGD